MDPIEHVLPATPTLAVDLHLYLSGDLLTIKKGKFLASGFDLELPDDYEIDVGDMGDHLVVLARHVDTGEVDVVVDYVQVGGTPLNGVRIGAYQRLFMVAHVSVRETGKIFHLYRRKS